MWNLNILDTSSWLCRISLRLLMFISHPYNVILWEVGKRLIKRTRRNSVCKGNCPPEMKSIWGRGRKGKGTRNTTQTQSSWDRRRKFWRNNIQFPAWTTHWGPQTKAWLLADISQRVLCVEEVGKGKQERTPAIEPMRPHSYYLGFHTWIRTTMQINNNLIVIKHPHSPT